MKISDFAQKINHPLCEYLEGIPYEKENKEKTRIWFLSGDPTAYGAKNLQMPQQGYQILRKSIANTQNHGYGQSKGNLSARSSVLKIMKTAFPITQDQVYINHGVNVGLLSVLMAFSNEGDQILVPEIGYPFFEDVCPALKTKAIKYKLKEESNFQIDLQYLATLVNQKTQFLFVINPSNPMGTVFSKTHMEQILQFANKYQLPIVSDEVYYGQVFPTKKYYSFAELTVDVPVIALSGMQKNFSVPGWCVSWTIIVDKHKYLDQIKNNLNVVSSIFLHPNTFVQSSIPELFDKVGLFINKQMGQIQKIHDMLYHRLSNIRGIKPIKADGTIYISAKILLQEFKDIKSDKEFVSKIFQEENINAFPLSIFGGNIEGIRLLTCARQQFYEQFFTRLEEFLKNHLKKQ